MKVSILLLIFFLVSCNPGDGGIIKRGGDTGRKNLGGISSYLVGPMVGIAYDSESNFGVSTSQGQITCKLGEVIDFYLPDFHSKVNDIYIGSATCSPVISIIEMITYGAHRVDSDVDSLGYSPISNNYKVALTRILRILQSIDSDRNPQNGISISKTEASLLVSVYGGKPFAPEQIFGNYTASTLFNNTEFEDFLNSVMTTLGRPEATVSADDALNTFEQYRFGCDRISCG